MSRIVCQFSCGAASAVATKLLLSDEEMIGGRRVEIVNAYIEEEHPDNRRFLLDCQRWFDREILVLRDEKYKASVHRVWKRKRFIVGQSGASCAKALKRDLLEGFLTTHDSLMLGYTVEEAERLNRFIDAHNGRKVITPLIKRGLTKADCLAIVERAGIELPAMYKLGYENSNCVGCCKGGEGYWNKIRRDFPERFATVAAIQEMIGPGAYFFRNRKTAERFSLRQLDPKAGRHDSVAPECSFFCEIAEQEIKQFVPAPASPNPVPLAAQGVEGDPHHER